jgi:hypothetical protein
MTDPTTAPRELAQRWAWWRNGGPEALPKPLTTTQLTDNIKRMSEMCVTSEERERLFAWVRAFPPVAKRWGDWMVLMPAARHLAEALGIGKQAARDLLHAAGWPS